MKLLMLHCDYFSFATTQPTKFAEQVGEECKSCGIKDTLVIFTTVERKDERDPKAVVECAVHEINTTTKRLGVRKLIVYPFVHLSAEAGSPQAAKHIIDTLYQQLQSAGYEVKKAPFGWEKVFSLTSKGHPLSESFKTIEV